MSVGGASTVTPLAADTATNTGTETLLPAVSMSVSANDCVVPAWSAVGVQV